MRPQIRNLWVRLGLVFLLCCVLLSGQAALADVPAVQADSLPRRFGIVDGYWRPQAAAELGATWERITFDWSRFQPQGPGDFQEDAVREEWLNSAQEGGREVVGMILNTPAWASTGGLPSAVPAGLYEPFDSPENLWAVFLRQLATETTPLDIRHWIIWNTPDIQPGDPGQPPTFEGTVEDYYRLVKVAYQAIKAVNDEANVYLGGLVWWNDIAAGRELYLKRYLAVALDDPSAAANHFYFDGVTLNIKLTANPIAGIAGATDSVGDITTSVRRLLAEAGLRDKSIWIAELNASPTADPVGGLPDAAVTITPEQQADFLVQATAMGLAAGAERLAVFKLYDSNFTPGLTEPFGLLRFDNSRRPAFDAYAFAIRTFSPTRDASAGRSRNGRLMVMEQAGRTVYVMWTAGVEAVNFWVESRFGDEIELYDAFGNRLPAPRIGVGPDDRMVFVIETPAALPDASSKVTVGGSPRILVLTGEPRRVWAAVGSSAIQLR